MSFILSRLFYPFLHPITWIVILLLLAYWKRKRIWLLLALAVCVLFSNAPLCDKVVQSMAITKVESKKKYKLAIVLGGFMDRQASWFEYTDRSGRLMDAIRGYKARQIEKILITGDVCTWNSECFYQYMRPFGVPDSAFIFEKRATNTRENAVYTTEMIRGKYTDKETVLFTSATHMKRSLACFAKVGFYPDYISVDTHQALKYNLTSYFPSWKVMNDWFGIFKEWFGYGGYKLKGWC